MKTGRPGNDMLLGTDGVGVNDADVASVPNTAVRRFYRLVS